MTLIYRFDCIYLLIFFLQKSNDLQERASYLYLRGVFYMADHKNMEALGDFTRLAEIDIALVPEQYVFA
jgi:hypothetical protein